MFVTVVFHDHRFLSTLFCTRTIICMLASGPRVFCPPRSWMLSRLLVGRHESSNICVKRSALRPLAHQAAAVGASDSGRWRIRQRPLAHQADGSERPATATSLDHESHKARQVPEEGKGGAEGQKEQSSFSEGLCGGR